MAETVMRDHQPLLWMGKTLSMVLPFTLQGTEQRVSRCTLKSELMTLVETHVRALDFRRNQRW